jgi:hypothetical protein
MKRALTIAVAIALIAATVFSASAQNQPRQALAEELLTLLKVKENIERSLGAMQQMVNSQLERLMPADASSAAAADMKTRLNKVMEMVNQELTWDKMKKDQIALYADTFTEQELKDMIAFYKTPSGKAFIDKQPELLKKSMEITQKLLGEVIPKIQAMVKEAQEAAEKASPAKPETK